jgi:Stage III sporulation protein AB (spore_III_AB).
MLWLKTIGAVFIISGFGSYGLMSASSLDKRVEQIKNIRLAMRFLEKEITYLHTPLPLAMARAAECIPAPANLLFADCSRHLQDRQGITIHEAWSQSLACIRRKSDLNNEDITVLQSISSQMGMSGAEEQKRLFIMIQEHLHIQEDRARREAESGRKLRSYGGFILGATVVLLLL